MVGLFKCKSLGSLRSHSGNGLIEGECELPLSLPVSQPVEHFPVSVSTDEERGVTSHGSPPPAETAARACGLRELWLTHQHPESVSGSYIHLATVFFFSFICF